MATQAQLDAVKALIMAGDFDQARTAFREEWDELFLNFAMDLLVQGSEPVHRENLSISESWNLQTDQASEFGGSVTCLYGVPTVDQASVILPVTGVFIPPRGYRFLIRNGSSTNRLTIDPDGSATIDGASSIDIEPLGTVLLTFEGVAGREYGAVASSAAERFMRLPLGTSDAAAGLLSWLNPFGSPLLVRITVDVTTPATGAMTADFGQAATSTSSDNLIDGADAGAAANVFSSFDDQGSNGRSYRRVSAGEFITGSTASGSAAGLVGFVFVYYKFA